ncbi:MAG: diaminopimelate decarboxylase [Paracoccaceae bacterium]|nr:diaminopimelate decarboxylase [Paracoccaceae bacterium]
MTGDFLYHSGILRAEEVPIPDIVATVGTPVYVYSSAALTRNLKTLQSALSGLDHRVCYSVKANSNVAVLRLLGDLGAGMDVVSAGEYARARAAGVSGDRIVFSGVGKTPQEMEIALRGGIRQFNVESEPELLQLDAVARSLETVAPVAFRVNPDIDPETHEKISTGKAEDKFGIPCARLREVSREAAGLSGISVVGIDVHIGSQVMALAPFEAAFRILADLTRTLRGDGHDIRRLDVGGGLGIAYRPSDPPPPSPKAYGDLIRRHLGDLGVEIDVEPGRAIAGDAGVMVSSVVYRKSGADRDFLILDGAMNDLLRPAMYGAYHPIMPVREPAPEDAYGPVDVVGPVCETGDAFARRRTLPPVEAGDQVAFGSAGAYGAVMASEYNSRPLVPEVLVSGRRFSVIRPRAEVEEMILRDIVPEWLTGD